jgi:membrane associated rhomboid family serine protease
VSAVLFAFILFDPWSKLIIFPIPLPIPAIVFAVLYVAYSIWMDRQGTGKTNHSAHLWGAAYGILFTLLLEPDVLGHFTRTLLGSDV